MRLVLAAEIQSLSEIVHDRIKKNEFTLRLQTIEMKKMEYSKKVWSKSLKITKSSLFIGCLLRSIKRFQVYIDL
jgi:hypothetical protein